MAVATLAAGFALPKAYAKRAAGSIDVVPTISNISVANGQLVASGTATATVNGLVYTAPFSGVPVNISLAQDQSGAAAAGCPILDLALGPINLNLLGLVVQTSPICLTITAYENGGLLGDLLCSVADLLAGGLNLNQILAGQGLPLLPGLTTAQVSALLSNLTGLLNTALDQLVGAVLNAIQDLANGPACAILNLSLGPVTLNLLGLVVELDNCANGPVTVDITAVPTGGLLGSLLCQLTERNAIPIGSTLLAVVNQLLAAIRL